MSTNGSYTISQFFNLHEGSTAWVARLANSKVYAPMKQQMAQQMKGFPVPAGFDELVIRQLGDLLDIDMSRILIGAWRKRQEIVQYRDTTRYAQGEVHVVPLLEHTVTSTHSPAVQPIINNVPLPKISFDVVLKLAIKSMMLKISGAKITELLLGSCTGSGSIEYAGYAFVTRETAPLALPGSIMFREGIAI